MTSTYALAQRPPAALTERLAFTESQIDLIKRTVAAGATDDELAMFLHQCRKTGLDPISRQIYCIVRKTKDGQKATIQTGIDGYRLIAERTGQYAGSDKPEFEDWEIPDLRSVTVTVWKLFNGERVPFTATAYWSEFYPQGQYTGLWDKMPRLMLAKCAEAQALRKAFPADLSGVYVEEELHQAIEGQARVVDEPPRQQARRAIQVAPVRPQNAGADLTATEPQIKAIYAFANAKGLDQDGVREACAQRYDGLVPESLTRRQASEFIDAIKALPVAAADADDDLER